MQLANESGVQSKSLSSVVAFLLVLIFACAHVATAAAPKAAAPAPKAAAPKAAAARPADKEAMPEEADGGTGEEGEAEAEDEPASSEDKLDAAVELEIRYADELTRGGFPDYAKMVLGRMNADVIGPRMEVIKIQGLIALGKFEEVKKAIAARPDQAGKDAWAMKLALADGYFAWGKYKEARTLYDAFFKAFPGPPPDALAKFYQESAYRYAQMLLLMNDKKAAVKAFNFMLKAKLKKHVRRQVIAEMCEEMIGIAENAPADERKRIFEEVEKNLEEVLYGQSDLWFGKAMAMMAHMRVIDNDFEGAEFLLESFMEQLKALDGALRWEQQQRGVNYIRLSPLAQARYMIGDMMLKGAEKLFPPKTAEDKRKIGALLAGGEDEKGRKKSGALQHFVNVFYQYPSSTWAPQAGQKAKRVQHMLEEMGATVTFTVTAEQLAAVEKELFQEARTLFNQQQFKEAVESYQRALVIFPETENAVSALGELAKCYIEQGLIGQPDEAEKASLQMYVDTVVRYLAERFNRNKEHSVKAGDTILRIAGKYDELGQKQRARALNDIFFTYFTEHPRMASKLYEEGVEKYKANDFNAALGFFTQIQTNVTAANQVYYPAFGNIAMCYNRKGETLEEAKTLGAMVKELEKESAPGHLLANTLYRLAICYKTLGLEYIRKGDAEKKELGEKYVDTAIKKYAKLTEMLAPADNPYQKTAEEKEANARIVEGCYFYSGFCYSLLTKPEDKVKEYKQQALGMYNKIVSDFPKAQLAPAALSQAATVHTVLDQPDKAREVLDTLKKKYPDSDEAKNADYLLGSSLLILGKRDEAIKVFKEMFTGAGSKYTPMQIVTAGTELFKAGEFEIAMEAFNKVVAGGVKGQLEEPALLGQGRAMVEVGQLEAGVKVLEAFVAKFPKSRNVIVAKQSLSRGCSQLGAKEPDAAKRQQYFSAAVVHMKWVKKFDTSSEDWGRTSLAVADIYIQKLEAEKKFGNADTIKEATLKAVVPFISMIMSADLQDAKLAPYIEDAYQRVIPLYLQLERWKDAWEKADEYVKQFPRGKYSTDVRRWRGEADTKMTLLGISRDSPKGEKAKEEKIEEPEADSGDVVPKEEKPAASPEPKAEIPKGEAVKKAVGTATEKPAAVEKKPAAEEKKNEPKTP